MSEFHPSVGHHVSRAMCFMPYDNVYSSLVIISLAEIVCPISTETTIAEFVVGDWPITEADDTVLITKQTLTGAIAATGIAYHLKVYINEVEKLDFSSTGAEVHYDIMQVAANQTVKITITPDAEMTFPASSLYRSAAYIMVYEPSNMVNMTVSLTEGNITTTGVVSRYLPVEDPDWLLVIGYALFSLNNLNSRDSTTGVGWLLPGRPAYNTNYTILQMHWRSSETAHATEGAMTSRLAPWNLEVERIAKRA